MKEHLSPKQVARAVRVSESSIKRWCDEGLLKMEKTAGGHRRIAVSEVLRFVRDSDRQLVEPSILGLPATTGKTPRMLNRVAAELQTALTAGNADSTRQILFDLYVANHSLAIIGDHVLSSAFEEIGDAWACGELEIYQERRGCEITVRALRDLIQVLPEPDINAPLALGGTLAEDQYAIPSLLVEGVIRDVGWQTIQLGSGLPSQTIVAAIKRYQPTLVWLSISYVSDEQSFLNDYAQIRNCLDDSQAIAVGGRSLGPELRQRMKYTVFCENLENLQEFATALYRMKGSDS